MDTLLIYALSVYFLFHIANRSDLLKRPRAWVLGTLPAWMVYASSCAFCWTWWVGVLISFGFWFVEGHLVLSFLHLLAAPVVNLIVDLVVRDLIRRNEPPVLHWSNANDENTLTWTTATSDGTTWYPAAPNSGRGPINAPSVWVENFPCPAKDGEKIPPPNAVPPPTPFNPLDHEQTK